MASVEDLLGAPPPGENKDPGVAAGLPAGLWNQVKSAESNFNNNAVSKKGAIGASQVMPATAAKPGFGLKPIDPRNPDAGAPYLKKMIDLAGGDVSKGLAMYNAGPNGNLKNSQTTAYVDKIMKGWKPPMDQLLGERPSDLASAPPPKPDTKTDQATIGDNSFGFQAPSPEAQAHAQQQLDAAKQAQFAKEHPLLAPFKQAGDRTMDLMGQDTAKLFNDTRSLVQNKGAYAKGKAALNVALDAVGLPFSPITSAWQAVAGDPIKQTAHQLGLPTKYDSYVDAATQMALPIIGTRSAMVNQALGPIGQFLTGALGKQQQQFVAGQSARAISTQLGVMDGKVDAIMTKWMKSTEGMLPPNYQNFKEELFHAYDSGNTSALSPEALAFKKNVLDPVAKKTELLRTRLAQYGVDVGPTMQNYITRRPMDKPTGGMFAGVDSPVNVRSSPRSLGTSAPELKERTNFAVTDPNGNRYIAVTDPETDRVIIYNNKQKVASGVDDGKGSIKVQGANWTKQSDGTVREIEQHTNMQYHKDPIAAVVQANVDMQKALEHAKAIETIKTSPEFLSQARGPGRAAPADWRTVDIKGTNQFDGWKMHPQMAEVFEDFNNTVHGPLVDSLGKINKLVVGSLFYNPLPHIFNVLTHSVVEKGLVGNVIQTGKEVGRAVMPNMTTTTMDAWRAVWDKNKDYMRYMNSGAGLMYPSVYNKDFFNTVLKKVGSDPQASNLAKAFGYANPVEWTKSVYNAANRSLWFVNDVIMMQAYLEKERAGFTPAHAIADVEKHVPNYNVPNRVLGSRRLSLALRNPAIAAFGRYDYGRMASYGYMLRDAFGTNNPLVGEARAKALDQLAATAFISFFVYPQVMDKAAQALTGNKNASVTRYGPATIPTLVHDWAVGQKDNSQAMATALPQSPVASAANQLRVDRDSFTGQRILDTPQDRFNFLMKQTAPTALVQRAIEGKATAKQIILEQFGIKTPSNEQVAKTKKWIERERKAAENKRKKQGD
jgi:hypothetical protein